MKHMTVGLCAVMALACASNAEQPFQPDMSHISEIWINVNGDSEESARYLAYANLGVSLDGAFAFGWNGLKARVSGIYSNGQSVMETGGVSQPLSNIETDVSSVWLYEAWIEQELTSDASVKIGLQEINDEFDASANRSVFLHSSHGVGGEFGSSGVTGPSTYPYTGLGIRLKQTYKENYYVQLAVFDGVPGNPDAPGSTAVKLRNRDGALIVLEAGYTQHDVKILAGFWRYTAAFENVLKTNAAGQPVKSKGNDGFYALVEIPLLKEAAGDEGLTGFIRVGIADRRFNDIARYLSFGGVYTGLFPNRGDDQAGFAVVATETGEPFRKVVIGAGGAIGTREISLEATYKAWITDWAYVQPDMQYVINPGMIPDIGNALFFGVRFGFEWVR